MQRASDTSITLYSGAGVGTKYTPGSLRIASVRSGHTPKQVIPTSILPEQVSNRKYVVDGARALSHRNARMHLGGYYVHQPLVVIDSPGPGDGGLLLRTNRWIQVMSVAWISVAFKL